MCGWKGCINWLITTFASLNNGTEVSYGKILQCFYQDMLLDFVKLLFFNDKSWFMSVSKKKVTNR